MTGRALGGESFLIKAVVAAGVTTRDRYMPDFIQKLAKELPMIRPLIGSGHCLRVILALLHEAILCSSAQRVAVAANCFWLA
jgi:predicted TIM-barrel enzyme